MTKLRAAARAALQGPRDGGRRPRVLGFAALALVTLFLVSACAGGGLASEKGWSVPIVLDGTLYVGNRDGQVLSFEAARLDNGFRTGAQPVDLDKPDAPEHRQAFKELFQAIDDEGENSLGFYASPLIVDDRVIIGGLNGNLYALSREDLAEEWRFRTRPHGADFEVDEGRIFATADAEGDRVFVADEEGYVYAVRLDDGAEIWKRLTDAERFWSGPAAADGVVYVGGMDQSVYALDAENGELNWRFDEAEGAFVSTPLVVGDTLYIGAFDNTFYAIDRHTGEMKHAFEGRGWFWNDAIHVDGTIFVGDLGGMFYALDAADLSVKWRIELAGPVRSKAAVYEDKLFIAARNGQISTVDMESGNFVSPRIPAIGKRVLADLVVAEGALYVRDDDERLHRFDLDREQ